MPRPQRGTPRQDVSEIRLSQVLVDTGSPGTYLARAILEGDGPLAARAAAVGAAALEDTSLNFPGAPGGLLGFDFLGAGASFALDLDAETLALDEPAGDSAALDEPAGAGGGDEVAVEASALLDANGAAASGDAVRLEARAVRLEARALLEGGRPYPVVSCDIYGAGACSVDDALVDTGSPATLGNEAGARAGSSETSR